MSTWCHDFRPATSELGVVVLDHRDPLGMQQRPAFLATFEHSLGRGAEEPPGLATFEHSLRGGAEGTPGRR